QCLFGGVGVDARVLSSSAIECLTPLSVVGSVQVGVSVEGYGAENSLYFRFREQVTLSSISPLFASTLGGQNIALSGTGFTQDAYCVFNSTVVPTAFLSDTLLSCAAPPHALGVVEVTVLVEDTPTGALSFTYTPAPAVTALTPPAGVLVASTGVNITGSGLNSVFIECSFHGTLVPATVLSDAAAVCTVPSLPPSNGVGGVFLVLADGHELYTASYTLLPLSLLTDGPAVITPSAVPRGVGAVVRIMGGQFYPSLTYTCALEPTSNSTSTTSTSTSAYPSIAAAEIPALVLSASEVSCTLPPQSVSSRLVLRQAALGVVANLSLAVLPQPHLLSARADAGVLYLSVSGLGELRELGSMSGEGEGLWGLGSLHWACLLDGVVLAALVADTEVLCYAPTVSQSVQLLSIDARDGFASNTIPVSPSLPAVGEAEVCPQEGLTYRKNSPFLSCPPAANNTMSALQRRLIDQSAWFRKRTSTPPRPGGFQRPLDVANYPSADILSTSEYSSSERFSGSSGYSGLGFSGLYGDSLSSSCAINSNTSCFSVDGDEVQGLLSLAELTLPTHNDTYTYTYTELTVPTLPTVLHSVQPHIISTPNGSWVTLSGRGFAPTSQCTVGNTSTPTYLESVYLSSSQMQCLIPPLSARLFLSLGVETPGGETHTPSLNTLPLVYDILADSLRPFEGVSPGLSGLEGGLNIAGGVSVLGGLGEGLDQWCTSKFCSVPHRASNATWTAFMDASSFGVGNFSYSSEYTNELRLLRAETLGRTNHTAREATYASEQEAEEAGAVVLLMSPQVLDLSPYNSNSSDVLYFYGTNLQGRWYTVLQGAQAECYPQSDQLLACPIHPTEPGIFSVLLLSEDSQTTPLLDLATFDAYSISTMAPLRGASTGGTLLTIMGQNLLSVVSCSFRLGAHTHTVSVHTATPYAITFITPAGTGTASVEINTLQGLTLPTGHFKYYPQPEVALATLGGLGGDIISVFGHKFPLFQAFCNITYTSGSQLISAETASTSELTCRTSQKPFIGRVVSVSVSFNGQDFLSPLSTTYPALPNVAITFEVVKEEVQGLEAAQAAQAAQLAQLATLALTLPSPYTCNEANSVPLYGPATQAPSQCLLDGVAVGAAQYLSPTQMLCTMPPRAPGLYALTLSASTATTAATRVRCLPRPKVAGVKTVLLVLRGQVQYEATMCFGLGLLREGGAIVGGDGEVVGLTVGGTAVQVVADGAQAGGLVSVSPSLLDRGGGTLLQVAAAALPDAERLYCHFGKELMAASRSGSSLSCVSPTLHTHTVSVSVGSQYEIWSDALELAVSLPLSSYMVHPPRGSLEGGTAVRIPLPASMLQPTCTFGGILATTAVVNTDLVCVTPPSGVGVGPVDVRVVDASYASSTFYAGTYTYEVSADVASISPSFVNQGMEQEVAVFGANFHDSPQLACLVGAVTRAGVEGVVGVVGVEGVVEGVELTSLPARWLSSQVLLCTIPSSLTQQNLTLMVTNNGLDVSERSAPLRVVPDNLITSVTQRAVVLGGEVVTTFLRPFDGTLYCRFNGSNTLPAYRLSTHSYLCSAPRFEAGPTSLDILDGANSLLASKAFTYYAMPVLDAVPPILSNTPSVVVFRGSNLHSSLVGRLRSAGGELVGTCMYSAAGEDTATGAEAEGLVCTVTAPLDLLLLELSLDSTYYLTNSVVEVFPPSQVLLVDPLLTSQAGGSLHFSVDQFRGFSTMCQFTAGGAVLSSPAVVTSPTEGVCAAPALPLNVPVFWSLLQAEKAIFSAELLVVPLPVVCTVAPLTLPAGVLTALQITLRSPVLEFPSIECLVQGVRYPMLLHDTTHGVCVVQPAAAGSSPLVLYVQGVQGQGVEGASHTLEVVSAASDLILDTQYVQYAPSTVTITSPSCALSAAYCGGVGVTISTLSSTPCALACLVSAQNSDTVVRLDVCHTPLCLGPSLSTPLQVIGSVSLVGAAPRAGPGLGGVEVLLYGSGFTHDTMECLFGTQVSLLTTLSSTRAMCLSPPAAPGSVLLQIRRRGMVVSTSVVLFETLPQLTLSPVGKISSLGNSEVTFSTQELTSTGPYSCRFGDKFVPARVLGTSLSCLSPSLDVDSVYFALALVGADLSAPQMVEGGVVFSNLTMHARPAYSIASVSPLSSFSRTPTPVTLRVMQAITGADFSTCCFGDTHTPALLLSNQEWQCYSPPMQFPDSLMHVPVGLARREGFCEYFGFEFTFYAAPHPLSTYPSSGSMAGGTPLTLTFQGLSLDIAYCRIGLAVSLGQVRDNTILCVTPAAPVGVADVEISTNGVDFISMGFKFEFLPVVPSFEVLGEEAALPVLFFVQPNEASTLQQGKIMVRGENFRPVISPAFGPRRAETVVTLYGQNLGAAGALLCRVGEDWSYALDVTPTSARCLVPRSPFSGKVDVRLARSDRSYLSNSAHFEYIEDPVLFDAQPSKATLGTDLLVTGVTALSPGEHSLTFSTNGQHFVRSGVSIHYQEQAQLHFLWPLNGPALRGGTLLSIYGANFEDNLDLSCMVDMTPVPALTISPTHVQCRTPPHRPGMVNISLLSDGALLHPQNSSLQFLYAPDVSVDKITPEFGYTSGDSPVFVFGSNFINTTSLGCKFGDMMSRGVFLTNLSILCLTPSPLGRSELANLQIPVEVTINGYDFSESNVQFRYSEPCDAGFFCPASGRNLCPNGTYCPVNSRNFTLCPPGTFQPKEGAIECVICPIGYLCPDQGMPRPVNCPPGLICDSMGLRSSSKLCPNGHYCLNGTKSSSVESFQGNPQWITDFVTGVVYFNQSSTTYNYDTWPPPAVGQSRSTHPPERHCDGLVCAGGTTNVLAEAPFPCPIGHYCRAGVGSVSPEGTGPCPNGYFCPTQLDAIVCPQGHYCPGVGNTAPVECYPGTYNPFEGQGNCTVCPTGYICPSWGTLLPEPCPSGFVCMSLGLSYPVVLCPAGYRCGEGTLTMDPSATSRKKPQICRDGEFCLGGVGSSLTVEWIATQPFGGTQPQLCAEGTYCQAGAFLSSGSGLCFQGHYCPPSTSFPIETPLGNFASGLGSVAPTLCYPGTYAPLSAQIDCLVCPSGHTCITYGTYVPTICLEGTYRSQVDSITCTQCPTGTYSYEVGATDLSMCLPCPRGRICGIKRMVNLAQSTECPPGYICGYGTDRSSQFAHLTPAGFHTAPDSIPTEQYEDFCKPGFYCPRGTPTYAEFDGKCPVGSFCPKGTPAAINSDTKCPMFTTSLSQSETLQSCRIR
ncbi:hypothetical protein B484DRAFT_394815, partial [Ochromonadaceae sp. CCMP2298]